MWAVKADRLSKTRAPEFIECLERSFWLDDPERSENPNPHQCGLTIGSPSHETDFLAVDRHPRSVAHTTSFSAPSYFIHNSGSLLGAVTRHAPHFEFSTAELPGERRVPSGGRLFRKSPIRKMMWR